jgi:hypothetical protein
MRAGLGFSKYLNPKECWKLWHSLGGLSRVREHFLKKGVVNPKTGNPPTIAGIEKAAFAWALENKEEARKDLAYSWQQEGHVLDDEKWDDFLYRTAKLVFYQRHKKFSRYIEANGLQRFLEVK